MRYYCSVPGCKSGSKNERKRCKAEGRRCLSLFKPPRDDDDLFEKWKTVILGLGGQFTRDNFVCEQHFQEDEIERFFTTKIKEGVVHKIERQRLLLKHGSVPSIFSNLPSENLNEQHSSTTQNSTVPAIKQENDISCYSTESSSTNKTASNNQKVFENFQIGNTNVNFLLQKGNANVSYLQIKESSNVIFPLQIGNTVIKCPQSKVNSDVSFLSDASVYNSNDCFSYNKLLECLSSIKKPTDWWSIAPVVNFISCVRWNNQFVIEKTVIIDQNLNVKIFVKERPVVIMDHMKVNSIDEISRLLAKVEAFGVCAGASDRTMTNCLACLLAAPVKGRPRMWCKNCLLEREKKRKHPYLKEAVFRTNEKLRLKLAAVNKRNSRMLFKIYQLKEKIEEYKKMNDKI